MLSIIQQRSRKYQPKEKKNIQPKQTQLQHKLSNYEEYESVIIENDISNDLSEIKEIQPEINHQPEKTQQKLLSLCFYKKKKSPKNDIPMAKKIEPILQNSQSDINRNGSFMSPKSLLSPKSSNRDIDIANLYIIREKKIPSQAKENVLFLQGQFSKDAKSKLNYKSQFQQKSSFEKNILVQSMVTSPVTNSKNHLTPQQPTLVQKRIIDEHISKYKGRQLFIESKLNENISNFKENTKVSRDKKLPFILNYQINQNKIQIQSMLNKTQYQIN